MKSLPVHQRGQHATLDLFDELDTPWIAALIDEIEAAEGRPWRELLERIARLPVRAAPARRAAVIQALRSLLTGRQRGAIKASDVRQHLLGRSAFDPETREARLAAAATALSTTIENIELAMWSDLPLERAVVMPHGRPTELAVAAAANLVDHPAGTHTLPRAPPAANGERACNCPHRRRAGARRYGASSWPGGRARDLWTARVVSPDDRLRTRAR